MLKYCIPAYRLPKDVLKKEIDALEAMGITFKLNAAIGEEGTTLKDLQDKFNHVFLATGAWGQRTLDIEKSELLTSGVDFLIEIGSEKKPPLGDNVLVIGGGNVAMDVAVNACRLGAKNVTMVCLESRDIMPAFEEEIEQALSEGVTLLTSLGPDRILEKDGRITGMEFVRCTSVFDESGAFNPSFDREQKQTVDADQIILAIGQATDLSYAAGAIETRRGLIVIDDETKKTNLEGVLAGGDVTSGPASVIHAITAGRKAAAAIAQITPESHLIEGQPLEMHFDCQKASERTPNLAAAGDLQSEAERCANCGCVAVNVSDLAPALIALEAKIVTTRRTLGAEDFFTARVAKSTVLDEDELVKEVEIPAQTAGSKQGYFKFRIRNAIDFPIVSLAYVFSPNGEKIEGAKIVLGAVAPTPLRIRAVEEYVEGKPATMETADAAGNLAVNQVQALAKNQYKVQIVKGLLKKMVLGIR